MNRHRLDWSKYTNFRYRKSKDDLRSLCNKYSAQELKDVFETPDKTGLFPIHWAAIHNRSDMIEIMVEKGSSLQKRCTNKLLSEGTPLHLAALNGSIEAAAMLLAKAKDLRIQQNPTTSPNQLQNSSAEIRSLLEARDLEGQTPLMRTAAPRSKRMDTIRDLLRKNLWSFNGRPAETALFLICNGADWNITDSSGLNLLHLAIINDHDDIVSLLLTIDTRLCGTLAKVIPKPSGKKSTNEKSTTSSKKVITRKTRSPNFNTVVSRESPEDRRVKSVDSAALSNSDSSSEKSFIGREERALQLASKGLTPLELSILYSRVNIISILWNYEVRKGQVSSQREARTIKDSLEAQREAANVRSRNFKELRMTLLRACWTNPSELTKLLKQSLLKVALILDLALMTLIWAPAYFSTDGKRPNGLHFGVFLLSFGCTLAMAIRAATRNPGYLRKNTPQYANEISDLMRGRNLTTGPVERPIFATKSVTSQIKPLIQFNATDRSSEQVSTTTKQSDQTAAKALVADTPELDWRAQLKLKDRVRLLCHKCKCIRTSRSRHCNYCNHCIQEFDHHCIYIGSCIGRNNRVDFFMTLMLMTFTSLYGTIVYLNSTAAGHSSSKFWSIIGLISIVKYLIAGAWNAFFMLRRACFGVTMYENLRSKRIRKIFGPDGPQDTIVKSHKMYTTSQKGSFWRYAPSRFLPGHTKPYKVIMKNLAEFFNQSSVDEYLMSIFCSESVIFNTHSDIQEQDV